MNTQVRYQNDGPRDRWIGRCLVAQGATSDWVAPLSDTDGWIVAGWLSEADRRPAPSAVAETPRRTYYRNTSDRGLWIGGRLVPPGHTSDEVDALPADDRWIVSGWAVEVDRDAAPVAPPSPSSVAAPVDDFDDETTAQADEPAPVISVGGVVTEPECRAAVADADEVEDAQPQVTDDLDTLTVLDLRKRARAAGVPSSVRNRGDLLAALRSLDTDEA